MKADPRQAFVTDIATQHGRKLRRYLAARLRNAADVPDLVQEVFLRLLRIERHESIRNPEGYVMTVAGAGHVLHQHTLRLATAPENMSAMDVLVDLQEAIESDPVTRIDAERRLEALDQALERLAPNLHATLVLHRRDGMTLEEIAQILGVSRPMVKKYLSKALLRCREQLRAASRGQIRYRIQGIRCQGRGKRVMNRETYREASEWLVELRVGEVDAAARDKLDAWFRTSPEHIRPFLELSSIWEDGADPDLGRSHTTDDLIARARAAPTNVVHLEAVGPSPRTTSKDYRETSTPQPAIPTPRSARTLLPVSARSQPRVRWRASWGTYLAASVAIIAFAVATLTLYGSLKMTYATGIGEQRTVLLADGSQIELNARSAIRVHFSKAERDVDLIEGQALFKVAKDASRPFVVKADGMRVRAVGTEFDVYRKASGTTITVVEGRVAVLPEVHATVSGQRRSSRKGAGPVVTAEIPTAAVATILVSAGEQVTVTPSQVTAPTRADVSAARHGGKARSCSTGRAWRMWRRSSTATTKSHWS